MALENPFKSMSKTQVYASLAGFAGITGYLVYRHHKTTGSWNPWSAGSGASPTTSTTQVDPVTGLPYSQDDATDPLTGLGYLAEAEQYGSVAAAEADVSQFGLSSATGSGIGVSPATYPVNGSPSGTQTGSNFTSNAAWSQAVQAGLTDVGYPATDVAAALGAYLTQRPVTAAQASIIAVAIAEYGNPPVGTFQVIQAPASGPAGPKVPGTPGLSVTPYRGYADFGWHAVTGATGYELLVAGAGGKGTGTSHFDETVTGLNVEHLTLAKGAYYAEVRARNPAGTSPYSPRKTFTIKE